ncbi:unnamed protein product [Amoebophrya sp. A25]|nr:unnamed protein product [Amoebophrya sp. A25]|eukprot:GSA25T00002754001.1
MVKRKRLGKNKTNRVSLKDLAEKRQKQAEKELKKTLREVRASRDEHKVIKRRKANAPAPIEKRKGLGYAGISAGAREQFERAKEARAKRRVEKLLAKEAKTSGASVDKGVTGITKERRTDKKAAILQLKNDEGGFAALLGEDIRI